MSMQNLSVNLISSSEPSTILAICWKGLFQNEVGDVSLPFPIFLLSNEEKA
jgi:hypothetical protein